MHGVRAGYLPGQFWDDDLRTLCFGHLRERFGVFVLFVCCWDLRRIFRAVRVHLLLDRERFPRGGHQLPWLHPGALCEHSWIQRVLELRGGLLSGKFRLVGVFRVPTGHRLGAWIGYLC